MNLSLLGVTDIAPKYVRTPQSAAVVEGSSVKLDCRVAGSPTPIVRWYKAPSAFAAVHGPNVSLTGGRFTTDQLGALTIE
jgi:hypothetical protein